MIKNYHISQGRALTIIALPFIFTLLIFCGTSNHDRQVDRIRKLNLFYKVDIVNMSTGKVLTILDTSEIYYIRDVVIHAIPTHTETESVTSDSAGNLIYQNTISTGVKYTYYVYNNKDFFGAKYNTINEKESAEFPVDSFLNRITFKSVKFYQKEHFRLVKSVWNSAKNVLIEDYAVKAKPDETYSDTIIYKFSKALKDFDFTFSKELDSLKSIKLCKINMITNPIRKGGTYSIDVPRREFIVEIVERPVLNAKEIIVLVTKFEKQHQHSRRDQ